MGNIGSISTPLMENPPASPIDGYLCTPINTADADEYLINNLCARAWKDGDQQFAQVAFFSNLDEFGEDLIVFKANGRSMKPLVLPEGGWLLFNAPQSFPADKQGTQVKRLGINMFLPQWFGDGIPGESGAFLWAQSVAYYFGDDVVKVGVMGEISLEGEGVPLGDIIESATKSTVPL